MPGPTPSSREHKVKAQPSSFSAEGALAGWCSSTFCIGRRFGRSEARGPTSWHRQHLPRKALPPSPPPP
eukprot:9173794-Alexandrium_andersonii.AAC.1